MLTLIYLRNIGKCNVINSYQLFCATRILQYIDNN